MKKVGKEPRLLPSVMEAIARLKEKQGSTQKQIVDIVGHILKRKKDGYRNVAVQVRRALEHGLQFGLIKQRGGKFKLGLDRRDYAILRRFGILNDLPEDCSACRRRRRNRRRGSKSRRGRSGRKDRRRRRKYRKYDSKQGDISDGSDSGQIIISGSLEPMEKGRRRRHRSGRKGRGGRRSKTGKSGRRRTASDKRSNDSSETGHKDSNTVTVAEKSKSDENVPCPIKSDSNHSYHQERQQNQNRKDEQGQEEDTVDCKDLEYVCSNKQGDNSPRCPSRENKYFKGSYLN